MESWFEESLRELMDHLIDESHPSLKDLAVEAVILTDSCIVGRGGGCGHLHDVTVALANELGPHLAWEEEKLFPLIRDIEEARDRDEPVPSAVTDRCRVMIGQAIETNGRLGELLAEVLRLDGDLESELSCHASLIPLIRHLSQELMHELRLENGVLYPRALTFGKRAEAAANGGEELGPSHSVRLNLEKIRNSS